MRCLPTRLPALAYVPACYQSRPLNPLHLPLLWRIHPVRAAPSLPRRFVGHALCDTSHKPHGLRSRPGLHIHASPKERSKSDRPDWTHALLVHARPLTPRSRYGARGMTSDSNVHPHRLPATWCYLPTLPFCKRALIAVCERYHKAPQQTALLAPTSHTTLTLSLSTTLYHNTTLMSNTTSRYNDDKPMIMLHICCYVAAQ
jgi:hypothetical protein